MVTELCRKHGMSEGTFYAWKAKYSGMTVSEAKRLKTLEDATTIRRRLLLAFERAGFAAAAGVMGAAGAPSAFADRGRGHEPDRGRGAEALQADRKQTGSQRPSRTGLAPDDSQTSRG